MGPDLEKVIHEISLRMRLLRSRQEDTGSESLTDREIMLLELLDEHGKMTVSHGVTKLWRDKLVSKTINPENQRVTIVALTEKGKKTLAVVKRQRAERFNTLFHAIETTDDEKQVFLRVLTRAIAYFDEILGLDKRASKGGL